MNGVLLVYKEKGFTSFDVCALMRGILKTRKIGHGGTLDPEAEGVLPVFVGNATKLCDFLPYDDKCYEAEMTLGITTDTEDLWGTVLTEKPVSVSEEALSLALRKFTGVYDQVPPMYSAKKINGKKLYQIARKGEVIERPAVPVKIEKIDLLSVEFPKVRLRIECGKGTYIRSLIRDIGEALGCGACMSALKRVRHGIFTLEEAHTVKEIETYMKEERISELLRPVESLFPGTPELFVKEEGEKPLKNGNLLPINLLEPSELAAETAEKGGFARIYDRNGSFTGIYSYDAEKGLLRPEKMFL